MKAILSGTKGASIETNTSIGGYIMTFKTCIVSVAVALFLLAVPAFADKSYQFTVSSAAKLGSVQLQPGEYSLVLDNTTVRLRDLRTGDEFEVTAKIDDTADKKFDHTEIHSTRDADTVLITEIRLGGTNTRVVFR
jgi:hypothetical protein